MKTRALKVLSLFDGVSCARVALDRIGYKDVTYYASEIDRYAIQIAQKNWPQTSQLGSVTEIKREMWHAGALHLNDIDLLIGGSPCQDLSIAKHGRKGLDGARSGLFWEYVRILNEVKPKYFVLENVASMPKEAKDLITKTLGVEPIMIDAALVSAQRRKRLFWVGKLVDGKYEQVNIPQPEDRGILLKDILEERPDEAYCVAMRGRYLTNGKTRQCLEPNFTGKTNTLTTVAKDNLVYIGHLNQSNSQSNRVYLPEGKSVTLSAGGGGLGAKTGIYLVDGILRTLSPVECERLQSLDDGYSAGVSDNQRRKACGNAFNVEVVKHILNRLDL